MTTSKEQTTTSLEQIRNILTGDQERENRRKFKTLEDRLAKDIQSARTELSKRLDQVSTTAANERAALGEELDQEVGARIDAQNAQAKKLEDLAKRIDLKLTKLTDRNARAIEKLGDSLRAESLAQHEELSARCDELQIGLEDVQAHMVGKEDLSGFFAEIALNLVDKKQIRRT